MTTWARLAPGGLSIQEISPWDPPAGHYTADVAAQFQVVPDGTAAGWMWDGSAWAAPPPPSPPPPPVIVALDNSKAVGETYQANLRRKAAILAKSGNTSGAIMLLLNGGK